MDYILIRAWGQYQRMYPYAIRNLIALAKMDGMPHNVIYKHEDGTWATIEDVKSPDRQYVEDIAREIQAKDNPLTRTIYG
jgi:hypothetical protein